ncbi:13326_t:CDS:1, partial [Dentiscutata heterogama]
MENMLFDHEIKNESFIPFILFLIEVRDIVLAKFSNLSNKEISNYIFKLWMQLPEGSKAKYKKMITDMRKNPDISSVLPAQKKRKFSDNFCPHPQYLVQNSNLIRTILSCTLPLSIVKNNEFRQFCSSLDSRFTLPNCDSIRASIINAYNQMNKLIQNKIVETAQFVALSVDFWSHSYIGVTCHWITHDFKLIDVILEVMKIPEDHVATEFFEKFQLLLSKLGLVHENIVSITSDNNNVKTALSQMQIEIIPCLANILRVSVEAGLQCANDILNKSKKLCEILNNDTNRRKLIDIQQQIDLRIKESLDVIDIGEDWYSTYQAIRHL